MNKAVAIVGPSGSGKTELICRLVEWLQGRGYRVAVLKHSFKPNLGDEGKDTGRYRRAGARLVALAAPGLLQLTRGFQEEPRLGAVLATLAPEADLILVEGYKSSPLPKVALLHPQKEPTPPAYPQVIALVSPQPLASPLPVFQPGQVAELGGFLEKFLGLP
jgi:molybdopterin-guanine dinucleotide biosynthesis protein B